MWRIANNSDRYERVFVWWWQWLNVLYRDKKSLNILSLNDTRKDFIEFYMKFLHKRVIEKKTNILFVWLLLYEDDNDDFYSLFCSWTKASWNFTKSSFIFSFFLLFLSFHIFSLWKCILFLISSSLLLLKGCTIFSLHASVMLHCHTWPIISKILI